MLPFPSALTAPWFSQMTEPFFLQITYDSPFFLITLAVAALLSVVSLTFMGYAITLRLIGNKKEERRRQLETEWEPLILQVMSGHKADEVLQNQVRESDQPFFLDFLYRFARTLRGGDLETIRRMAAPFLEKEAASLHEASPEQRARSVQILGLLGFSTYADRISQALRDPSPLVAMVAARALARRQHPEYVEQVLVNLHRFADWSSSSLSSLLSSLGVDVIPLLRSKLEDEELDPMLRACLADALCTLNDVGAADVAAHILDRTTARPLITACLRLLKQVAQKRHLPLIQSLSRSSDFVVRLHAVGALSSIGGPPAEASLRKAVDDSSPWVAFHAVQGLKKTKQLPFLRSLAASDHPRAEMAQQALFEETVTIR